MKRKVALEMGINVTEHPEVVLDVLLEKVYRDSGYDFRKYRRGTVTHRLERKMLAAGADDLVEAVSREKQ